jgi:hypothetical protein
VSVSTIEEKGFEVLFRDGQVLLFPKGSSTVLPTSATAKYRRGSENENIVNIGENIGKYRKMSQGGKKYKNIHFFSIF